jgi:hypothetical protein
MCIGVKKALHSFSKLFIDPLILAKKLEYRTDCRSKDQKQKDRYSEYFCIVVHIDYLWKGFSHLVIEFSFNPNFYLFGSMSFTFNYIPMFHCSYIFLGNFFIFKYTK